MKIKKSILKEAVREVIQENNQRAKIDDIVFFITSSRGYDLKKDKLLNKIEKLISFKIPDWPQVEEPSYVKKLTAYLKKLPNEKLVKLAKLTQ